MPHFIYADFGPEGHADTDPDTGDTDEDRDGDRSARGAGGPMPVLRDHGDYAVGHGRVSDNLFEADGPAFPGVLGE